MTGSDKPEGIKKEFFIKLIVHLCLSVYLFYLFPRFIVPIYNLFIIACNLNGIVFFSLT